MRIKRISYVVYPFDLMVFFGGTFTEIEEYLKKFLPEDIHPEIKDMDRRAVARTMMFSSGQTCIRFKTKPDPGTIAHEAFHAVQFLFKRTGMKLTLSSGEAYAYLIGYIVNKINSK